MRFPVVGVMGSGREEHADLAEELGRTLAALDVHLLTGGGAGVMRAVSRGFATVHGRKGLVLGVLPSEKADPARTKRGYPNEYVDVPIRTHLPDSGKRGTRVTSRNHVNVLTSDVVVALPGGAGTSSEVRLAVEYDRPIVALVRKREDIPDLPASVLLAPDVEAAAAFVQQHLPTP